VLQIQQDARKDDEWQVYMVEGARKARRREPYARPLAYGNAQLGGGASTWWCVGSQAATPFSPDKRTVAQKGFERGPSGEHEKRDRVRLGRRLAAVRQYGRIRVVEARMEQVRTSRLKKATRLIWRRMTGRDSREIKSLA
jgi:hypothetical protein